MAVEYLASNEFTANGVQTDWTVSFKGNRPDAVSGTTPYLNSTDVLAQEITPATSTTAEIVVQKTCVAISPNVFRVTPVAANGHIVRIYRATQDEYNLVDYKSRQTVTEADLDLSNRQNIFIVQETSDQATRAVVDANNAVTLAYTAINTANASTALANSAISIANSAAAVATNSVAAAAAAQAAANAATAAAALASSDAAAATAAAENAVSIANAQAALVASANATANNALTVANGAVSTANGIAGTANAALAAANNAASDAAAAVATANAISATANSALSQASAAVTTANAAAATANGVDAKADTAIANASTANTNANAAVVTANAAASTLAALTTTSVPEGTRLYYTDARVRAAPLTGYAVGANSAIVAADTVMGAVGKLQAQLNDRYTIAQAAALWGSRGSSRNYLDNADFQISQRNSTALTSAASGVYFYDRWRSSAAGTTVVTGTQTAPQGFKFLGINAGQICQIIDMETMVGGSYTLSQQSSATLTLQRNGTTIATLVGAGQVTFTFDRVGATSLILYAASGNLILPQLEEGTVATPFKFKPKALELLQAQRYFVRMYSMGANEYQTVAGVYFSQRILFPTQMQATPTLVTVAPGWTVSNLTSLSNDAASVSGYRQLIQGGGAAGGVAFDFAAGDFVQASCEP
jgi:hypothetical protein